MLRFLKDIYLLTAIAGFQVCCFAQGSLQAILLPAGPSAPPLAGFASVYTPNTNGGGIYFPVSFQVTVNSDQVHFDIGRIAGGGTAWVFDVGSPTIQDGSMVFIGSTDMQPFQIDDMLSGRTQLEIQDNGFTSFLSGQLVSVPEPQTIEVFALGIIILLWRALRAPFRISVVVRQK